MAAVIHRDGGLALFALIRPILLTLLSAAFLSGCQVERTNERLTVASAGRISSLDPAQASTISTIQLLSATSGCGILFDDGCATAK